MSKNILASKTFWLNLAGIVLSYGGVLPPKYSVPVLAVANIGVRLLTNQPLNIWPK